MEKLDLKEKYLFCSEMKTILSSGMSVEEGLHLLKDNLDGNIAAVSAFLIERIRSGESFEDAVSYCGSFDDYFVQMVRIGQINGCSDKVMDELSMYYKREDELQSAVRESIGYPLVLSFLMMLITGVLRFAVIPVFESILKRIGVSDFSSAANMMRAGKALSGLFFALLAVILAAAFLYWAYIKIGKDSSLNSGILMKMPFSRNVYRSIMTARITYALSLFAHSGYPLEDAVSFLPLLIKEEGTKKKLLFLSEELKKGKTFSELITGSGIYSGLPLSMLNIGLKSGKQEETFEHLCEIYEKESSEKIAHFLGVIEPSMIACLSMMVGAILLSVMLPLLSIMSMVG